MLTPLGRLPARSVRRFFTLLMTSSALTPKRCSTMPLATSPFPLSSVRPRRSSGPSSTRATSCKSTGVPPSFLSTIFCRSGTPLRYPATAHDEFKFGQLDRAAADIHVAGTDDVANFRQRHAKTAQALRIDHYVIL